ncbi:MAG: pitrilysin family protein [Anaerolineales bacterium]
MTDRPNDLPDLDVSSLPGPETIERQQLQSGTVVLARENFASPSIVISGYLPAGALADPDGKEGLADLTASALMRGTEARSFNEIYESIESIGASLHVSAGTHFASFRGKALATDLDLLLALLAEVLQSPAFPEKNVEQLRGEKLTGLALRDQATRAVASMTFDELAYADHPYRRPSEGTRDSVARLTLDDLRDFHQRHFSPAEMVVSLVGAVKAGDGIEAVRHALAEWNARAVGGAVDVPDAQMPSELVRRDVAMAGKTQSDIVLGTPGPRRSDPSYLAASLGNSVLGRFGLMGRIGDSVREQAGLAYYAYSSIGGGIGPGPWQVAAGVNPANADRAIDLIRQEVRRFVTEPVTEEELADVKANFIGRLPLQLESNEGVSNALLHTERYGLGLDYYQRFPSLVTAITREQVLEVAARFLDPDKLAIAVAGPEEPGAAR